LERRLAAILAADVVGYSRLMEADESGTLARLTWLRKEQIEPLIATHRGRVVKLMGDGILAEFASVVDAVGCAAAWQTGMADADLRFRIGINVGDVIAEDGDIYGNGVNVAARLEALADPGGICLSGNVRDEVRGKLDLSFQDMGAQTVKNIAEPVRAYRVVLDAAAPSETQRPATPHSGKPALAVLPFNNMSGEPSQEGFTDGITEDIITALSRSHGFDVTARNSTFAYKGKSPDIREVARALGVSYVLEGSVRQGGGRARITVQLIDAVSGNHVWADRYDRSLDDEFAVQDEIAQRISSILTERIWQDVARDIGQKRRQDYSAYDYAYRGMELLHRVDPVFMLEAIDCEKAALALDPDLFIGHAVLGFCYLWSGYWGDPDDALLAQAHHHALRAAEIAPEEAQTYRLLSRTHSAMGRWEESWDCVQRALRIDPSDGDIIGNRGVYHLYHGEPGEAVEWIDKVLEMHSDTPHTVDIMRYWKATAHFAATDYASAVALLSSISGLEFIKAELLAACHAQLNQTDLAQARATEVLRAYPAFRLAHVRLWKNFRNEADRQNLLGCENSCGAPSAARLIQDAQLWRSNDSSISHSRFHCSARRRFSDVFTQPRSNPDVHRSCLLRLVLGVERKQPGEKRTWLEQHLLLSPWPKSRPGHRPRRRRARSIRPPPR
jgi:adenylate cyclase